MIKKRLHQKGFTIIELMIATTVLATMLLLVTVVIVNIGNLYYKGINQSRVQDNTRSITEELGSYIQLSDQPPTPPVSGPNNTQLVCVGDVRYTYVLGVQIGHQAPPPTPASPTVYQHVLWRDKNPTPGSCSTKIDPSDPSSPQIDLTSASLAHDDPSGSELITNNSRLTEFSMSTTSPSKLSVGVAYGDDDLLCNPTAVAGSCTASNPMTAWNDYKGDVRCKGGQGGQFCSTSKLNTTAVKRLGGGSS